MSTRSGDKARANKHDRARRVRRGEIKLLKRLATEKKTPVVPEP